MRQSHMIFILISVAWVFGASLYGLLYYPEAVERDGFGSWIGGYVFWLWPIGLSYSVYLTIQNRRNKIITKDQQISS